MPPSRNVEPYPWHAQPSSEVDCPRFRGPDEWKGFFCVEPYSAKPYILQPGESKVISLTIEATDPRR